MSSASSNKRKGESGPESHQCQQEKKKRKDWTTEEEYAIAVYMQENYQQYKISSKAIFTKNMKKFLGINCEDERQIINKLQMMEQKYKTAKLDFGRTGEGLTEGTMEHKTWEGLVKSRCHYYFVLDAVMGTRANITPPYEINSSDPLPVDMSEPEHDVILEAETAERQFEQELFGIVSDEEQPSRSSKKSDTVSNKRNIEHKKVLTKLEKGSGSTIGEALKLQAQMAGLHYEQLAECKKLEISNNSEKIQIEKERLKMESAREDLKLRLQEKKLAHDIEMEKIKIEREREKEHHELEKLKLQIELAKLHK